MRISISLILIFVAGILISPASLAKSKLLIGGDVIEMETRLGYAQGTDTYYYKGSRFRFGVESSIGVSLGLEYTPGLTDEAYNVVGTRFRLETEDTLGLYFTAGEWIYLRIGWSSWKTKYTHVSSGISNWGRLNALDYGIGFKTSIGPNFTIYGEFVQKNTNVNYDSFFVLVGTEHGDLMYDSEMLAVGVYFSF